MNYESLDIACYWKLWPNEQFSPEHWYISKPEWTKMSEICINIVKNIDEVEQIDLITICNTKVHRYISVT